MKKQLEKLRIKNYKKKTLGLMGKPVKPVNRVTQVNNSNPQTR
jgi:hypothetical protein